MVIVRKKGKPKFWQNPKIIDPTPKIKPRLLNKLKFLAIVSACVLVALVWFLFFSPYFQVKNISIEGDASPETKLIIEKLNGRNIFLIGGRRAERDLQRDQSWIKSIKIIRGIPDTVRVRLIERDAAFGWKTGDKTYLIDKEGVVFKEVQENKLSLITDNRSVPVKLGDKVVTVDFIDFIESLRQVIPLQTDLKIIGMQVDETTFHLAIVADKGFKVIFDTLRPLQSQLDDFNIFYKEKKDDIHEYVDMRVEGIVYYK